jgi:DNA-binding LytR/AlgR family response regulator
LKNYQVKEYKKRFICKVGNKVIFKQAEEIAYFFVDNKITFIQEASTGKKFMVSHSLEELEQQHLDPSKFYRINRSTIINLGHLIEMKKYNNGRLKLFTRPPENLDLIVARDRVSDFKNWINQ